jgi:putative Mg2+ transporter-C (MgtC) family protein
MPVHLSWVDLVVRLACTVVAGIAIGFNREEHGKAAGMRTTLIVCLAACVAMIQVNQLLPLAGRSSDSFVMNDLMRLPLGILTGVGFIGAGTIMRRSDVVVGVTTAATLWLVTVIGLCFGGGQIGLGWSATGLGLAALWVLGRVERRVPREHAVRLTIECDSSGPPEAELRRRLSTAGLTMAGLELSLRANGTAEYAFEVRHLAPTSSDTVPKIVLDLGRERGVARVEWRALT